MAETLKFLAIDLGAESGRGVVGLFDGQKLRLEEGHRFPNGPVQILDRLHWDVLRLFAEMKRALGQCVEQHGTDLAGMGVDTWGVDFGLLDRNNELLGNPYHYRDSRTDGMMEEAFRRVPREEIFERTGIQFMQLNTLYQLLAMVVQKSPLLEVADTFLTMPDLFNFWLTGRKVAEFSEATTTQFYDPRAGDWAKGMLEKMGVPTHFLPEIVPPGTVLGSLWPSVAEEVGLGAIPVVAPACHDTGSAVAAVPTQGRDYAYLSSGTWSLMGAEVSEPIINEKSLAYNFTNEGGVCHTFRFLKNIMGLWLVQQCRQTWERAGESLSYDEITQLAAAATPFRALIDPDQDLFLKFGDMPAQIAMACAQTGQPVPVDKGSTVRCALESLALKYRWTLDRLEELLERKLEVIHVVGGGTQNKLLCQFTANATQRPVLAGPIEATAIGNVMMQALALGHVGSLEEAREVIRNSFEVIPYEPTDADAWEEAYGRFQKVLDRAAES